MVLLERLRDIPNGALLVVPLGNRFIGRDRGQRSSRGPPLNQQRQLSLRVEAAHLPRRVLRVIPDPVLVAVGIEDHRTLAGLLLQAVGIQLRLLPARLRVAAGALGLDQAKRFAVVAP